MIRSTARRGRVRSWLVTSRDRWPGAWASLPRLSGSLVLRKLPRRSKLDADELNHPILLDQNGQTIRFPTNQQSGPVSLTDGALPSYVAYQLDSDDPPPKGFPTVVSGSGKSDQTGTGPLHLVAPVKAQLDQTLAKDGQAAVYNGQNTYLVKPLPPLFGTTASPGGTTLAWIASQR